MGFGQIIEVALKDGLIKVLERYTFKRNDEVCRDDELFDLGSLFSPVRLFQWQVAVADKPSEGDGAILDGPIFGDLPLMLRDRFCQLFPCLSLGEFRSQAENHRCPDYLRGVGLWVEDGA